MAPRLLNSADLRGFSFTLKSPFTKSHDAESNHHPRSFQLRNLSRTEAAIKVLERKANSYKYRSIWLKVVMEALGDAIKHNRWESALKIQTCRLSTMVGVTSTTLISGSFGPPGKWEASWSYDEQILPRL